MVVEIWYNDVIVGIDGYVMGISKLLVMVFLWFKFGDEFFVGLEYKYIVFFVVYNNDVFIFIYSYFFGF